MKCYACYWISSFKNTALYIFPHQKKNNIKQQLQYIQHPFSLHNTQVSKFQTFPPFQTIFFQPNFHVISDRGFQAFLPPLGCILAFAVFPTANSLAATAAPTQMAMAQGLISGSRTLAEGVSPVLFGGGKSGGDGTWKKWKKWNKLHKYHFLPAFCHHAFMCWHVERSNWKFWKWMSRLSGCVDVSESSWRHAWFQHV